MADGDPLPKGQHVVRYCADRHMARGEIAAAHFTPRPDRDNGRLSTGWVECAHLPPERHMAPTAVARVGNAFKRRHMGDRFAVMRVGPVLGVRNSSGARLSVVEASNQKNPCHCAITGLHPGQADFVAAAALAHRARQGLILTWRDADCG